MGDETKLLTDGEIAALRIELAVNNNLADRVAKKRGYKRNARLSKGDA